PRALPVAQMRQTALIRRAAAEESCPTVQQLILAADQFLVQRATDPEPAPQSAIRIPQSATGRTVIAGYHWFNDWGRDTMIALPGLALATGRADEAADILRTFARYVVDGLLPNNFPDSSGQAPGY